jgi:hypothetical protein
MDESEQMFTREAVTVLSGALRRAANTGIIGHRVSIASGKN